MSTPDLLADLDRIADMARDARRALASGLAVNGTTALRRIETTAADAARLARDPAPTPQPVAKQAAQGVSVRWWPGRTDEVRRVADRMLRDGQPDGNTTNGTLAARYSADVWIVKDAADLNAELADALDAYCERVGA